MTVIAWAIFTASIFMMHPRDRNDKNFTANNTVDCGLAIMGICFLIYYSGKP